MFSPTSNLSASPRDARAYAPLCAHKAAQWGQKVLFVLSSRDLIDTTINEELLPLRPTYPVYAAHSGKHLDGRTVAGWVEHHFRTTPAGQGEIVFITFSTFLKVSPPPNSGWLLSMGEWPRWLQAHRPLGFYAPSI